MKKKVLILLCAVAVLLGVRVFAAGGTSADPLISVSYLMDTFAEKLQEAIAQRTEVKTATLRDDALDRVDALGNAELSSIGVNGWTYSGNYKVLHLKRGDTISLYMGSGLLWFLGQGSAEAGLVDITTADEPASGERLKSSHRYLNGAETPVLVTVLSDAAQLSVEGYWLLTESDERVTPFVDVVKSTDWFYDAVQFAYDRKLFNGVSPNEFAPTFTMNRAMLATVLYRMEGEPKVTYSAKFPDVPAGEWFSDPAEWAGEAGILKGYEDGTCRPYVSLTREVVIVMLYRYAGEYLGLDVSTKGNLSAFSDGETVSDWARDAVEWAVGIGILTDTKSPVRPGEDATRAEVAAMLQRMILWIEA